MRAKIFQFGKYELDMGLQELRSRGIRLRVPASRLRLLVLFVTRKGDLLTREEIAACLWKDSQNIDVMSGINTAVNQLRAQLGDGPASPKFIETVVGVGYRFVADVVETSSPVNPAQESATETGIAASEESPSSSEELNLDANAAPSPARGPVPGTASAQTRPWTRTVLVAAALVLIASPIAFYAFRAGSSGRPLPAPDLQISRVTGSGDVHFADISPDGKYLAYVRETGGQQSIWLKQLATGRAILLAGIGELECPGLAFSVDGNYVYYVRKKVLEPSGELYQVPFLGGVPLKLLDGISGVPAVSPDGHRVAFVRSTLATHGRDSLVIAALDGSNEQVLASYNAPGIHLNRITWTEDGKNLVYTLQASLMTIPVDGGPAQKLTTDPWQTIDDLWSLPTSQDLIAVGQLPNSGRAQIFDISLAGGAIHPITHDLSHYTHVRASADGKSLVAVREVVLSTIQVLVPGHESEIVSLGTANENYDGVLGLAWTPQGRILYYSESNQLPELIEVGTDGSAPRQVAGTDWRALFADPVVSPRGDFVAATRWHHGDDSNIWRIEMSGGDGKRLTSGKQDGNSSITPDGLSILYESVVGDESVLMKVPSQGGVATKLTDYNVDFPAVSPDGKWIACSHITHPNQSPSLAIVPIAGGQPERVIALPDTTALPPLAWTPDGRAVTFINNINGVGNIWQQPVSGGPATPVTHFTSGSIFSFQWSRDGRLALSRGTESIDAVLITNFR